MQELAPIIRDLAVILGVAGITALVFQKIRQPVVLGYLVAGMIVGPYTPPYAFVSDIPNIKVLAELGVIFLMFYLGLEFSFHKLTKVGFSASVAGIFEVVFMTLLGFFIGKILGWNYYNSLFLGAAISISSTTIIIKALEELNLTKRRFADIIFGILVVEDLLAILILVTLSTLVATENLFSVDIIWAAVQLVGVVTAWFLIGYFLVPYAFRKIMHYASEETLTITSIALCLFLVTAAAYFHYSTALGAFIMGSILAETPQISRIRELTQPIRDIFAAVFFVSVGMLINPQMIFAHWPLVLFLSIVTIIGKIITSGLGVFVTGQSLSNSLRIGFSMAQIGELSFIIVGLGVTMSVISDELYAIIVAVSVVTTFTTPYLIRVSSLFSAQLDKRISPRTKLLLDNYSGWVYRTLASNESQAFYRKAILRFLINGIVVALIFIISLRCAIIFSAYSPFTDNKTKLLAWCIALILSSPFVWAMLAVLKESKTAYIALLKLLVVCFTVIEITYLSTYYFHAGIVIGCLLALSFIFILLFFKKLEKYYAWFERRLTSGLTSRYENKLQQLAPWDTHLVNLIVSGDSSLVGKTLTATELRTQFGVNVVAIQRGSKIIFAPRGEDILMPYDKLVVLGHDEQLELIKPLVENSHVIFNPDTLKNVSLHSILIEEDSEVLHHTIRDSQLREQWKGIVVGLERQGVQIMNPDPAKTKLQIGDLLLILVKE